MKILCCHPHGLMYTEIYLRLEPLGVQLVAQAFHHQRTTNYEMLLNKFTGKRICQTKTHHLPQS